MHIKYVFLSNTIFCILGPKTWGQDYPMCDSGSAQSPINLDPEQALESGNKIDEGNASISFSNNWWTTEADGELFNNGHTRKKLNQITNFDIKLYF